jgi:EmrB/QacA subfamily drug resistance transporter
VTGFALIVGPAIGGLICQTLGWRWVFWINLPFGIVAIALVFARLRESFGPKAALDIPGMAAVAAAALAVMWGLLRGNVAGWSSDEVLGAFVLGVLFATLFVIRELRAQAPMVPMRLFRTPAFSAGVTASLLFYAAMYGVLFLLPQFLQTVLGFGPLDAGLRLLPWTATLFITAPVAGALVNRFGERSLVVAGLLMQAIGLGWIAAVAAPGMGYLALVTPLVLAGTGVSMAMPAAQNAILSSVAVTEMGKASGIFNMARFLGGMFGIAAMVAVFSASGAVHSVAGFSSGFASAIMVAAALSLLGAVAGFALPARHRLGSVPKPHNA